MRRMLFTNPNFIDFTEGQNTFRKGDKWADLKIGEKVEIALAGVQHGEAETVVGEARVVGVVVGKLAGLLGRHAHNNHETFAMGPGAYADDALFKILRKIYPETSTEDLFTAVYLDRTPEL